MDFQNIILKNFKKVSDNVFWFVIKSTKILTLFSIKIKEFFFKLKIKKTLNLDTVKIYLKDIPISFSKNCKL